MIWMRSLRSRCWPAACAALCFWLAGCQLPHSGDFAPARTTLPADRVVLPATYRDREGFIVEVRINGKGPYRLTVDTGAGGMFLSERAARDAGVEVSGRSMRIHNAHGKVREASVGRVAHLALGQAEVRELEVIVGGPDLTRNLEAFGERSWDGVVGLAVFKDWLLELDFPRKTVSVLRPGTIDLPPERAVSYSGSIVDVEADLSGKPLRCTIDSGYIGGFAVPPLENMPLQANPQWAWGVGSVALDPEFGKRTRIARLAGDVQVGPVSWKNPQLTLESGELREGLIGVDVLRAWRLVVDPRRKQVFFLDGPLSVSSPEEQGVTDARFLPGFFGRPENGHVRILEVDDGSSAHLAGLQENDLVLELNGKPAMEQLLTAGVQERMRVRRGSEEFETRLASAPDYAPRQVTLPPGRMEMPATSASGALVVSATIGGRGPYRLLVSTGGRPLQLSRWVIQTLSLTEMAEWRPAGTRGVNAAPKVVWIDSLELGEAKLLRFAAVGLTESSEAALRAAFGEIDGVLGVEVFRDLVLELDFAKRRIAVGRPGAQAFPAERAVPFAGINPIVVLDVAGVARPVIVDTASRQPIALPFRGVETLLTGTAPNDAIGFTPKSVRGTWGQVAGSVKLGAAVWHQPVIVDSSRPTLGLPALRRWTVVVDGPAKKLYLLGDPMERRVPASAALADVSRRAGFFAVRDQGALRLVAVDEGGAYWRAGLRPEDVIVSADGKKPADIRIADLTAQSAKASLRLQICRGAEERTVTVSFARPPAAGAIKADVVFDSPEPAGDDRGALPGTGP